MIYNTFICTILFDISESSKMIALFIDFILKIIEFKVTEKSKKAIFRDFGLNYLSD